MNGKENQNAPTTDHSRPSITNRIMEHMHVLAEGIAVKMGYPREWNSGTKH